MQENTTYRLSDSNGEILYARPAALAAGADVEPSLGKPHSRRPAVSPSGRAAIGSPSTPSGRVTLALALIQDAKGGVTWHVDGGEGQFAGASGLIISNFFASATGEVTAHHCGVLFVP